MKNPYKSFTSVNPQPEKGTRRIASDIYLALILANLGSTEYQIVHTVIHSTWGFKKNDTEISYGMFKLITGKEKPTLREAIRKLVKKRILLYSKQVDRGTLPVISYQINKFYDTWVYLNGNVMFTSSQIKWVRKYTSSGNEMPSKVVKLSAPTTYIKKEKKVKEAKISTLPENNETELTDPGQKLLQEIGINPPKEILPKTDDSDHPDPEPF